MDAGRSVVDRRAAVIVSVAATAGAGAAAIIAATMELVVTVCCYSELSEVAIGVVAAEAVAGGATPATTV